MCIVLLFKYLLAKSRISNDSQENKSEKLTSTGIV